MNLVTIYRTFNDAEAHVARSVLEASGIDVSMINEELGSTLSVSTGGVRLQVREEDAEEARQILATQVPPAQP
ncbi:MAG TPA: DUF2007 domain-containing protein [Candidatus Acidoferrum sp.]|nr:DUF2007 domain-containing protein [Candidatus Acidoferrum sp.]